MKRIEQKVEDTWCLEDMFESDDFWEEEFGRLQRMIFQYEDFEGTLGESADRLLEYLKFNDETNLLMERLYEISSGYGKQHVSGICCQSTEINGGDKWRKCIC